MASKKIHMIGQSFYMINKYVLNSTLCAVHINHTKTHVRLYLLRKFKKKSLKKSLKDKFR